MLARVLLLLLLLIPFASAADILVVEGTLNNVGGFPIGVVNGDEVEVEIDYDPSTPPLIPGFNAFQGAIHSFAIAIPAAGIDLVGTGEFVNSITLLDDVAGSGDSLTFSIDGITGTTMLGGETVTTMNITLQETLLSGGPDLLTSQTSLPTVPLDFETAGTLTMGVGMSLTGGLGNVFTATSFDPVPEPAAASGGAAVLTAIVVLRRRARRAPGG